MHNRRLIAFTLSVAAFLHGCANGFQFVTPARVDCSAGLAVSSRRRASLAFPLSFVATIEDLSPRKMIALRSSSAADSPTYPEPANNKENDNRSKRILLVWVHLLSIFIATNYFRTTPLFPYLLLQVPPPVWALAHSLGAMAFAGGILTTTLLEWNLPELIANEKNNATGDNATDSNRIGSNVELLLRWLFRIESTLVLPGVTLTLISGVIQSHQNYGSLRYAPVHVKSALHLMLLFAAWWVIMDRRSQRELLSGGGGDNSANDDDVGGYAEDKIVGRRVANVVSCLFLVILYGVMVLKPGINF